MLNKKTYINKKAMSIIEVMIAIFIFTLGTTSVLMILSSASITNTYNKNSIIASNLAREQGELIRNIRDTNYKKFQKWNMLRPSGEDYNTVFEDSKDSFYKFENNLSDNGFHITSSIGDYIQDFEGAMEDVSDNSEEEYRLCLDNNNFNYVYCGDSDLEKTIFYRYIEIRKIEDNEITKTNIENSFKINSKVYWNQKGIHKIEIPTILADYKRL